MPKESRPLVSVIVPVYNREDLVENCLQSISNQTYDVLEIIVIDDGSSDRSGDIIKRLALSDSRIILIQQKNAGVSSARNAGIERSTGDFLMFVDSDDTIGEQFIEKLCDVYKATGVKTVYGSYEIVTTKKTIPTVLSNFETCKTRNEFFNRLPSMLDNKMMLSPVAKLYNAHTVKRYSIKFNPSIKNGEDLLFNLDYTSYDKTYSTSSYIGYNYIMHNGDSLSRELDMNRLENSQFLFSRCTKYCKKNTVEKEIMPFFAKYYIKSVLYSYDLIATSNIISNKDKMNYVKRILASDTTRVALHYEIHGDLEWFIYRSLLRNKSALSVRILSLLRRFAKRITR